MHVLTIIPAKGQDICGYLQGIVKKNKLEKYFKLNTEVIQVEWDGESSKGTVMVKDLNTGKVSTEIGYGMILYNSSNTHNLPDKLLVVISAVGPLHHPKWPGLKNIYKYKGSRALVRSLKPLFRDDKRT